MAKTIDMLNNKIKIINNQIKELESVYQNNLDDQMKSSEVVRQMMELNDKKRELMQYKRRAENILFSLKNKDEEILKPKKEDKVLIDNIYYSSDDNNWVINYHKGSKVFNESINISEKELKRNKPTLKQTEKRLKTKLSIYKYSVIKEFDRRMETNFLHEYLSNKLNCFTKYNLIKLNKSRHLNVKNKISLVLNANREKNSNIAYVKNPKVSLLPAMAACGLGLIMVAGINNISKATDVNAKTEVNIEHSKDKSEKTENIKIVTKEYGVSNDEDNLVSEVVATPIDNKYYLDNIDLSTQALEESKSVNTNQLNCSYYKTNYICIINNNEIIDVIDINKVSNMSLDDLINQYNDLYDNVEVYLNFDGYDENDNLIYSKIGWTNINNIHEKGITKTLKRVD